MSIEIKTIAGRTASVPFPTTYNALLKCASESLGLDPSTIRLLHNGIALVPPANVDDVDASQRSLHDQGLSSESHVVAIGIKRSFLTPSPMTHIGSTPPKQPLSPSGPLSFPHVPDGLIEFEQGMRQQEGEYEKYRFMENHVTMKAIRDVVNKDPKMLEKVLQQANKEHKPFVDVITEENAMFLDVINGKKRRYMQDLLNGEAQTEQEQLVATGFQMIQAIGEVLGAMGAGAEIEVQYDGDDASEGGSAHGGESELDAEDLAQIEEELQRAVEESNYLTAALCETRLAQEAKRKENNNGVLHHFRSAIRYASMMVEPEHSPAINPMAIGAASSVAPMIFISAQLHFLESGDHEDSLNAALSHLRFWDVVEASVKHLRPPTPALPLLQPDQISALKQYCADNKTTLVLYSLVKEESMYVSYVVDSERVTARSTPYVSDAFRSTIAFMEGSLKQQEHGVNASMVWAERLTTMHEALIEPIEDLLPPRPADIFANASHVCFVPTMTKYALPFPAMMDKHGIPAVAKWAVSQAPGLDVLMESTKGGSSQRVASLPSQAIAESTPAWLSRTIKKGLDFEVLPAPKPTRLSVLHLVNGAQSHFVPSDLLVAEKYDKKLIHSAAQARCSSFMRCMNVEGEAPYELMRNFYRKLRADGGHVANAAREAMLRCSEAAPDELCRWSSFCVLNCGGPVASIVAKCDKMKDAAHRSKAQRELLRASAEGQYAQRHSIGDLFDEMLRNVLETKPDTVAGIEDHMIAFLERNQERLERHCSDEGSFGSPSNSETVNELSTRPAAKAQE